MPRTQVSALVIDHQRHEVISYGISQALRDDDLRRGPLHAVSERRRSRNDDHFVVPEIVVLAQPAIDVSGAATATSPNSGAREPGRHESKGRQRGDGGGDPAWRDVPFALAQRWSSYWVADRQSDV